MSGKRCVNNTYKDTSGTTVRTILMGMKNGKELSANSVPPGGDSANFAELVVRFGKINKKSNSAKTNSANVKFAESSVYHFYE